MTIRNFDALFSPKAVALIGATTREGSVGSVLGANLAGGGFAGPILPVHPRHRSVHSMLTYPSVADLPLAPDLAVIATPAASVPGEIAALAERGCRAAIVISAGLGSAAEPDSHARRMLEAARPKLMRILGPNCLGLVSPRIGLNASFALGMPAAGDLAFVSQSGAVATAVLDWAASRGIGFSHVVSVGDMADIDLGDLLDYLALDKETRAILLYVEAVTDARKFMTAGRIAARTKLVVVIKAGRSEAGAKAAASHTGALAGADAVYDAAFRRAGMLRVTELEELFAAVETLSRGLKPAGDTLTILTNGGGLGVIAADAVERHGGRLQTLPDDLREALKAVLPGAAARTNPIDILGDARADRYTAALDLVMQHDDAGGAILVINCPTAVADSTDAAHAVAEAARRHPGRPFLASWVGGAAMDASRRLFADSGIPSYATPDAAARAFMHIVAHARNQSLLMETPRHVEGVGAIDRMTVEAVMAAAKAEGRQLLTAPEAKALLAAIGIPTAETHIAATPEHAAEIADRIGAPVALKIHSRDITHKSDVGGVRLDLSPGEVAGAAREMLARVHTAAPEARVDGFAVEAMVRRPGAVELIAGIADDPTFGPVVLFGAGGTATEIIGDRTIGLPPLNLPLAEDMIASTRIAALLRGYRDRPAADIGAVAACLIQLAELVSVVPEIAELDINPLLADAAGIVALDARIVLREPGIRRKPAIRPYPAELEGRIMLPSGDEIAIRPIRPEDEPALVELVGRMTPEDRRLRFLGATAGLKHPTAARLTQIDYDREMALVALDKDGRGLLGVARLIADPDRERAEFAVMVRSDMQGRGIGFGLMRALIAHARAEKIGRLIGEVLPENATMLQMVHELGGTVATGTAGEPLAVTLDLARGA